MKGLIIPKNDTGWAPTPETFVSAIRARFPGAQIMTAPNSVWFSARETTDLEVQARWSAPGKPPTLVIERAGIDEAAELCLWYRTFAPIEQALTFCDETYSAAIDLATTTTAADIRRAFGWT
jgi:hypothetical protein